MEGIYAEKPACSPVSDAERLLLFLNFRFVRIFKQLQRITNGHSLASGSEHLADTSQVYMFSMYISIVFSCFFRTHGCLRSCMRARSSTLVGSHGLCWEFDQMKAPSCPVKKLGPLITDCSACDSEMPDVDALDSSLGITPNGNSAGQSPHRVSSMSQ